MVSALAMLLWPGIVAAAIVAAWDMTGEPGDQTITAGTGSENVAASDMIRGPGLMGSGGNNSFNSKGWNDPPATDPGSDDDYMEFGFDVTAGFQVILDELNIGTRSSNTGPGTLGVFTSVDGFASSVATIVQPGSDEVSSTVDLGSLSPVTGDFRIRLIEIGNTQADGVGTTSSAGTFRIINDPDDSSNLVSLAGVTQSLVGPAPIAEPSSALVFVLLSLLVGGCQRRKRKSAA
jgi:hypothetical protein